MLSCWATVNRRGLLRSERGPGRPRWAQHQWWQAPHLLGAPVPPCLPSWGPQQDVRVTASCGSPDQYLVISSEMARWMGLSGGRSPDLTARRLVSGTGPGGNEPLPGRRLLPCLAQRSTLQRQTETGGLCKADTASHLPACQSPLSHISCLGRKHQHILSQTFSWRASVTFCKLFKPLQISCSTTYFCILLCAYGGRRGVLKSQ